MTTHHNGPDLLRWLAILGALLAMALLMCGCQRSTRHTEAQTDKADTVSVNGTAHVPGFGAVPIEFRIERSGSEELREKSETQTQLDGAAIAQQVGAVVGKSLDAAISKLTGLQMQSRPSGPSATEGGLAALLAGSVGLTLRELLARRREQNALAEVKASRDRAQAEALELAKRIDPRAAP